MTLLDLKRASSLGRRAPVRVLGDDGAVGLPLRPRAGLEVLLVHEERQPAVLPLRRPVVTDPVHVGAGAPLDHVAGGGVNLAGAPGRALVAIDVDAGVVGVALISEGR